MVMSSLLQRFQVLEALYECLIDDKRLYDVFCDRLDAGENSDPFLI
jgi:hypothetical protein